MSDVGKFQLMSAQEQAKAEEKLRDPYARDTKYDKKYSLSGSIFTILIFTGIFYSFSKITGIIVFILGSSVLIRGYYTEKKNHENKLKLSEKKERVTCPNCNLKMPINETKCRFCGIKF